LNHPEQPTTPALDDLLAPALKPPRPGTVFALPGTAGSCDAWLIARLARRNVLDARAGDGAARMLAVVTASAIDAQRLATEIGFFDSGLVVRLLPDWETLPYDNFSPHQDLISERLDTLYGLQQGACDRGRAGRHLGPAAPGAGQFPGLSHVLLQEGPACSTKRSCVPSSRWPATTTCRRWCGPASTACAAG
jgi:hypothetical protein